MVCFNIYYTSFSLTKNVKFNLVGDLYSSICTVCQVTHDPYRGNLELHKLYL